MDLGGRLITDPGQEGLTLREHLFFMLDDNVFVKFCSRKQFSILMDCDVLGSVR